MIKLIATLPWSWVPISCWRRPRRTLRSWRSDEESSRHGGRRRARQGGQGSKCEAPLRGRKNQCSFKTDSDELAPGCDNKLKKLANALVDAKKRLNVVASPASSSRFPVTPIERQANQQRTVGQACRGHRARMIARGSPRARSSPLAWARAVRWSTPDNSRPRRRRTAATKSSCGSSYRSFR